MGGLTAARGVMPLRAGGIALAVVASATLLGVAATIWLQDPPARDLAIMATAMAATGAAGLAVAVIVQAVAERLPFGLQLAAFTTIGLAIFVANVSVAAGLMFLSSHDLELLFILLGFSLVATAGCTYLMGRHTHERVRALENAATAIAEGRMGTRVGGAGRDSLGRISAAFNDMAAALAKAERRQQELEGARRELFAAISHDLRTPLAAIRATIEALADGIVTDEATRTRYLATASAEIARLSTLIDDLFELATIDGGELRLHFELLDVGELIAEAVDAFQPQVEQKRVRLQFEPANTPPVRADPGRLGRVLYNLLQNALRHTPPDGSIVLRTSLVGPNVEVVVSDTGDGIAPEDRDRIFERFYRGEKSRSREFGGSGLGLSIARGIVQAHGGSIRVEESELGATIAFTLPVGMA